MADGDKGTKVKVFGPDDGQDDHDQDEPDDVCSSTSRTSLVTPTSDEDESDEEVEGEEASGEKERKKSAVEKEKEERERVGSVGEEEEEEEGADLVEIRKASRAPTKDKATKSKVKAKLTMEGRMIPDYRREKQLAPEAQKILRVMEEAAHKLEMLATMPALLPEVFEGRFTPGEEPWVDLVGTQIERALIRLHYGLRDDINLKKKQAMLDSQPKRLKRRRRRRKKRDGSDDLTDEDSDDDMMDDDPDDDEDLDYDMSSEDIHEAELWRQNQESMLQEQIDIRQKMRDAIRDVQRGLRDNPRVLKNIQRELTKKESVVLLYLAEALRHLRRCGRQRLQELAEEKERRQKTLYEAWIQEKSHVETSERLRVDIEEANEALTKARRMQNETMGTLQHQIYMAKRVSRESVKRLCEDAETARLEITNESAETQKMLQEEVRNTHQRFESTVENNENYLEGLYRRKLRLETEISNWVRKYDKDMFEKKEEAEKLQFLLDTETEECMELQIHCSDLEGKYESIIEERRVREEMRILEEQWMKKRLRAVLLIQAFWRRWYYLIGRFRKKKGKKGKGGKGKGGKGKKKK